MHSTCGYCHAKQMWSVKSKCQLCKKTRDQGHDATSGWCQAHKKFALRPLQKQAPRAAVRVRRKKNEITQNLPQGKVNTEDVPFGIAVERQQLRTLCLQPHQHRADVDVAPGLVHDTNDSGITPLDECQLAMHGKAVAPGKSTDVLVKHGVSKMELLRKDLHTVTDPMGKGHWINDEVRRNIRFRNACSRVESILLLVAMLSC